MGHESAAKMKTPMEMDHSPAELKSPYNMGHESPADMKSPMQVGPEPIKPAKKKEYSFGEKLMGTARNIGDYATAKIKGSRVLDGMGITNPQGFDFVRKENLQKSRAASSRAAKRRREGSSFFMKSPMEKGHESAKQEKKDLMKYNPIDDRAGS